MWTSNWLSLIIVIIYCYYYSWSVLLLVCYILLVYTFVIMPEFSNTYNDCIIYTIICKGTKKSLWLLITIKNKETKKKLEQKKNQLKKKPKRKINWNIHTHTCVYYLSYFSHPLLFSSNTCFNPIFYVFHSKHVLEENKRGWSEHTHTHIMTILLLFFLFLRCIGTSLYVLR